jgi:hypothetical protein
MAIVLDEDRIPGIRRLMPWDVQTFLEIRTHRALEGDEYTVLDFARDYYVPRKLARSSIDMPKVKNMDPRLVKRLLRARRIAAERGISITIEQLKERLEELDLIKSR